MVVVMVEQEFKNSNEGSRNTFSYLIVRARSRHAENNAEEDSQIDVVNVLGQGLTCQEKWGHLSGRRIAVTRRNELGSRLGGKRRGKERIVGGNYGESKKRS